MGQETTITSMNDIIAIDNAWRLAFVGRRKDSKVLGKVSMALARAVDVFPCRGSRVCQFIWCNAHDRAIFIV